MNPNRKTSIVLCALLGGFAALTYGFWRVPARPGRLARAPLVSIEALAIVPGTVRISAAELIRTGGDVSGLACYTCHHQESPPVVKFDAQHRVILPKEHSDLIISMRNCAECHPANDPVKLDYAADGFVIVPKAHQGLLAMAHGRNFRNENCYNCHDSGQLDQLHTPEGAKLKFEQATLLCAGCHGTTYRDWEIGAHGRPSGFWDRKSGPVVRQECASCHDPHAPAFTGIIPMPPPHLLHPQRQSTRLPSTTMTSEPPERGTSRRSFLRSATALAAGVAAVAAGLAPLRKLGDYSSVDEFLQKYYKELTPEEMKAVLARIEDEVQKQYGIRPHVRDYKPMNGVEYVYALNLTRCVGCRKCVHACVAENNQSRNPEIQYIRVLKMPNDGSFDMDKGVHDYTPKSVPQSGFFYMPVQCHHCKNPPCVKVCPVKATWQEPDGITVIDYNWCIGCRYCEAACPYFARRFNFTTPSIPTEQINPNMSYLGNRPRYKGVMEKCHFCIQRTRAGRYPACVEVCPTGSRAFGNILDPNSSVSYILKNKRVLVLKQELGTLPRFFYYFDV